MKCINNNSIEEHITWIVFAIHCITSNKKVLILVDRRSGLCLNLWRTENSFSSNISMPRLEIFKYKADKTIKLGLRKKHEKRSTYTPREEEKRLVSMKKTIHLMFTPLTVTKSDQIVGHLLREISRILKFLSISFGSKWAWNPM